MRRITLHQGQALVSTDTSVEFTTVLGSCIAACLFDPLARLGGMNHFLLAEPAPGMSGGAAEAHHGIFLMDALVKKMIARGAHRQRLRAHIYGGANMHSGMERIGAINTDFARTFLARQSIALVHEDVGGGNARHVDFRPVAGRAKCTLVSKPLPEPAAEPLPHHIRAGSAEQSN